MKFDINHILIYSSLFVTANICDAVSTITFIESNLGEEINPFVDTSTIFSILLSPLQFIYFLVCFGVILIAGYDKSKTALVIRSNQFAMFLLCMPYYYLIAKLLAIINNLVLILGFHGPVSSYFELFGDSPYIGMVLAYIILAGALLPSCERYLESRFAID